MTTHTRTIAPVLAFAALALAGCASVLAPSPAPTVVTHHEYVPVPAVQYVEVPVEVPVTVVEYVPTIEYVEVPTPVEVEVHTVEYVEVPVPSAETLPPCAMEDSDNCYWDAATMGNGTGESFVTFRGVTYYAR